MRESNDLQAYLYDLDEWVTELTKEVEEAGRRGINSENVPQEYYAALNTFITELNYLKWRGSPIDSKMAFYLNQRAHDLHFKRQFSMVSDQENIGEGSPVPIGEHRLPPLPYAYDALEPYIDRRIMQLHHDKHHQSYVDGLNKAEKELQNARNNNDFTLVKHWEREAAFNGAGHYLHTIFWNVMSPEGGGEPKGDLMQEIERSFGSFKMFKDHFSEAAKKVEAVGWSILVWSPRSHRLEILQAEKHQNLSQWDVIPLLPLDVWEHAYYLQYENNRGKYVDNWWNIVNWKEVEKRYKEAWKVKWKAF
ncbi:superoxide dismutase [Pseudalkalibacillus caeni]|uniref:superoxide dismutase n=1 Tax=Exobacillus caeni TaxID=2574798 RepID=UPI001FE8EB56|nr:superoxide dismutase [Pseudalkalibacillus caeni]